MRYYCHHCHTQISAAELLPDYTCPTCHSGFVEEIPAQSESRRDRSSSDEGLFNTFLTARLPSDDFSDDNSEVEFLDQGNNPLAQVLELFQSHHNQPQSSSSPAGTASQSRSGQSTANASSTDSAIPSPQARLNIRTTRSSARQQQQQQNTSEQPSAQSQSLSDVINEFLAGLPMATHYPEGPSSAGGSANRGFMNLDFPLPFFLHSNPGDYAWGNAGFDAVITQLLNNLDGSNSGPPPMPKEQVDSLPTVKISDGQVKKSNLQCTVCMDDFQVDDSARQLPCEHFFHQDCIVPWLNLHASCPICRKTFATGTNTSNTNQPNRSDTLSETSQIASANNSTAPSSSVAGTTSRGASNTSADITANQSAPATAPTYDLTEDDCD